LVALTAGEEQRMLGPHLVEGLEEALSVVQLITLTGLGQALLRQSHTVDIESLAVTTAALDVTLGTQAGLEILVSGHICLTVEPLLMARHKMVMCHEEESVLPQG